MLAGFSTNSGLAEAQKIFKSILVGFFDFNENTKKNMENMKKTREAVRMHHPKIVPVLGLWQETLNGTRASSDKREQKVLLS
jgi:hypothetical protein